MDARTSVWEKIWKDKQGNQALWQRPNLTLTIWIILFGVRLLLGDGDLRLLVESAARLVLFAWAWMELLHGDNYFRRALGIIVVTTTLAGMYRLIS